MFANVWFASYLKGVQVNKKEIDSLNNMIKNTKEYKVGKNLAEEMIKYMAKREQKKVDNEILFKI